MFPVFYMNGLLACMFVSVSQYAQCLRRLEAGIRAPGTQTGTATMEISLAGPQKITTATTTM